MNKSTIAQKMEALTDRLAKGASNVKHKNTERVHGDQIITFEALGKNWQLVFSNNAMLTCDLTLEMDKVGMHQERANELNGCLTDLWHELRTIETREFSKGFDQSREATRKEFRALLG